MRLRLACFKTGSIVLILLNALGAGGFLWVASKTWPIPEEAGLCSMSGEPVIWMALCLPLFIFTMIVNTVWWLVARRVRSTVNPRRRWPARALVAVLWVLAIGVDRVYQRGWAENCPPGSTSGSH